MTFFKIFAVFLFMLFLAGCNPVDTGMAIVPGIASGLSPSPAPSQDDDVVQEVATPAPEPAVIVPHVDVKIDIGGSETTVHVNSGDDEVTEHCYVQLEDGELVPCDELK